MLAARSVMRNGSPKLRILGSSIRRGFGGSRRWREKRYTLSHEWVELSPDGKTATIGISAFASRALGDVVYVELPTAKLSVAAGDTLGAVESVKSASDIYVPVTGEIIEGNTLLEEKPGVINKGPEGDGWIAKIKVGEGVEEELKELMDAEGYRKHTEEAG